MSKASARHATTTAVPGSGSQHHCDSLYLSTSKCDQHRDPMTDGYERHNNRSCGRCRYFCSQSGCPKARRLRLTPQPQRQEPQDVLPNLEGITTRQRGRCAERPGHASRSIASDVAVASTLGWGCHYYYYYYCCCLLVVLVLVLVLVPLSSLSLLSLLLLLPVVVLLVVLLFSLFSLVPRVAILITVVLYSRHASVSVGILAAFVISVAPIESRRPGAGVAEEGDGLIPSKDGRS